MEKLTTNEIAELTFSQIRSKCILENENTKKFLKMLKLFGDSY